MAAETSTPKRSRWSLKASFWAALTILFVVTTIAVLVLKKSIWIELEIVLSVVSFCMFGFLFFVLYRGIVFGGRETLEISWKGGTIKDWIDWASGADTGGVFTGGLGDDPVGFLIGIVLDIVISMLLIFVIAVVMWLGLGALLTAIFVISVPLFFIFRRSLRAVVAKGRGCRGRLGKSFFFALWSTVTNTVWLYCILLAGHFVARALGNDT